MRLTLRESYLIAAPAIVRRKLPARCRWVRWIAGKRRRLRFADMCTCAKLSTKYLGGILGQ